MNRPIGYTQNESLGVSRSSTDRFWSHVDKENGQVHPVLGRCWPWIGRLDRNGYGIFLSTGKAHRIACEDAHGPPPFPQAEAAHACDLPRCCNGAHLSWKTRRENVAEQGYYGGFSIEVVS